MLKSLEELQGYTVKGEEGKLGRVDDFYFDSEQLAVRYTIVDTGNWLVDRKVLISPDSFKKPDYENQLFQVSLTKEEIENSPLVSKDEPVSR